MAGRTEKAQGGSMQRKEVLADCLLWNSKGHMAIWIWGLGDMQGPVWLFGARTEASVC